ncbi:recombinase family protein [Roseibium sp. TrichSKD4]|uniref:recombinase family protein n=1 Tax=Roseibium sp. TrichSKD4 TaxID=744980 RepID=UPI000311E2FD
MARIGYARVSSSDQNLDIQIERLKAVGCDIIRSETGSGSSRDGRGELETIIQFLHAGDGYCQLVEFVVHDAPFWTEFRRSFFQCSLAILRMHQPLHAGMKVRTVYIGAAGKAC